MVAPCSVLDVGDEDDAAADVAGAQPVVGDLGLVERQDLDGLDDARFATGERIEPALPARSVAASAAFVTFDFRELARLR